MPGAAATDPAVLPPPDEIRRTAIDVLQRPHYRLGDHQPTGTWLDTLLESIGEFFQKLVKPILATFDALSVISPVLAWGVMIVLFLICVAIFVQVWVTIRKALGQRQSRTPTESLTQEESKSPEIWEHKAHEAVARNDYLEALRYLFRACLLRIETSLQYTARRGATNREILVRHRGTPLHEPLALLVGMLDHGWYGGSGCSSQDYERCQNAHTRVCQLAKEPRHADIA